MQQSPSLFPSLQLSPDMYAHQFSGPATAPIYPNQRLFWDPLHAGFGEPSLPQPYQDHFQLSPSGLSTVFTSSSTVVPSFIPQESLPEEQPYDLPMLPRSSNYSHFDGSVIPAPFTTSPRVLPPQVENPSMFLSSPARRFGAPDLVSHRFVHNQFPERPAYAHQIEESRRELEMRRMRKGDPKQPSITRSVMEALQRPISPKRESRPGLKRSQTHTGVRSNRNLQIQTQGSLPGRKSPAAVDPNKHHRPERSSPLKMMVDPISRTLTASRNSNIRRGSLSLAIDENGVAKTIVTEDAYDMDLDDISGSEAESFDDTDLHILHSQSNSFAFLDNGDISHQSQTQQNRPYSHSKTSSHSTMSSNLSTKQSSWHSSASNTRSARKRPHLDAHIGETALMENESTGNAQFALRAIIQDRSRSTSAHDEHLNPGTLHSSPPLHQNQFAKYNASPTTITDPDLATPSTDRESLASNMSTRCVCSSSVLDGSVPVVQW